MAYQLKGANKDVVLQNLLTGKEKRFDYVTDYLFDDNGRVCLFTQKRKDSYYTNSLQWIDLLNGTGKVIWEGMKADNFVFDKEGKQLAFMVEENSNGNDNKSIWYYKEGMDKANV